jgi:hypothetical protein
LVMEMGVHDGWSLNMAGGSREFGPKWVAITNDPPAESWCGCLAVGSKKC